MEPFDPNQPIRTSFNQSDAYKAFERSVQSEHLNEIAQLKLDDPDHPAVELMHSQQQDQIRDSMQRQALLSEEAAQYYERAANVAIDPQEVEKLKFLAKHYQSQAQFKRSFNSSGSGDQTDIVETSNAKNYDDGDDDDGDDDDVDDGGGENVSRVQKQKQQQNQPLDPNAKDVSTADIEVAEDAPKALSGELKNLFLIPWERLYEQLKGSSPQSDKFKESFKTTLQKTQRNYYILMNIAARHQGSSSSQRSSSISSISGSDDIAQRLNELNNSLTSIQTNRMKSQIDELTKKLEEERKNRIRYQKEVKKHRRRLKEMQSTNSER